MNNCKKCPWLYDNEDWGCFLVGKECGGKLVDDEENGTYGCIFHQKVLQRLAHKLNKKFERLEKREYNGIFSGFKFYKFIPRNLDALKPIMKGGHTHNAFFNALNRLIFRGKNSRKFHHKNQFKKECVAIFYENMKIKENRRLIMETLNKHTRKMSGKQPLEAE